MMMRLTDDISILAQIYFLLHTCLHLLFPYLSCYCKVVNGILKEKTERFKNLKDF